jgi:hypothetical protein
MFMAKLHIEWIGGKCPVQAEGTIDGHPFYFRSRWNRWAFAVDPEGDPTGILMGVKEGFVRREIYGEPPEAGHISAETVLKLIERCADEYIRSMIVTKEEYLRAKQILEDHKICGNGCGCGQVFLNDQVNITIQYGQKYLL